MLSIRGNWLGLAMMAISGVIAGLCGLSLKMSDFRTMVLVGLSLFLMDLVFRVIARKGDRWIVEKASGGFFFFVPVWIVGLIVIAVNVINTTGLLK